MEFIAGIKLTVKNRMARRRFSVPNDDDTAGKRNLNPVGVLSPKSYIMPSAHEKRIYHIYYIENIYSQISVFRFQRTV